MKFSIGDQVNKIKGYPFPGEVRSVFTNKKGETRLVVESTVLPGMLHIFNEEQLCDAGERVPFDMKAALEALGGEWSTEASEEPYWSLVGKVAEIQEGGFILDTQEVGRELQSLGFPPPAWMRVGDEVRVVQPNSQEIFVEKIENLKRD